MFFFFPADGNHGGSHGHGYRHGRGIKFLKLFNPTLNDNLFALFFSYLSNYITVVSKTRLPPP